MNTTVNGAINFVGNVALMIIIDQTGGTTEGVGRIGETGSTNYSTRWCIIALEMRQLFIDYTISGDAPGQIIVIIGAEAANGIRQIVGRQWKECGVSGATMMDVVVDMEVKMDFECTECFLLKKKYVCTLQLKVEIEPAINYTLLNNYSVHKNIHFSIGIDLQRLQLFCLKYPTHNYRLCKHNQYGVYFCKL